jgi:nucleoside-diphosphate-sugar epimerase
MKRIGVIGANGQVGSEVCLLLTGRDDIQIVPICRTAVGASFLRRCGLEVRIGSVGMVDGARKALSDLDLVADFSLPSGSSSAIRAQIDTNLTNITRTAPPAIPLVYLSSILAFGNPDFHSPLKHYRISRNAYGSTKRYGERLAQKLCAKQQRPLYLFRVGVVHGALQAATRQAIKDIKATANLPAHVPDCDSYTVFAFSIAEALVSAAYQKDAPGLYTLVSNPAWSWADLHQYLCRMAGISQQVIIVPRGDSSNAGRITQVKAAMLRALGKHKEFLNGYIGAVAPNLEQQMRATYHMRNAATDIRKGELASRNMLYLDNFNVYPGNRLQSLSDSRLTMPASYQRLRNRLSAAVTATA